VSPSGGGDSFTTESVTAEEVGFGGFTPLKEHIHLFPGILKSGNKNVHQNLHVDNAAVLNSDLMKDILKDVAHFPTVKPKDWLDYGYYIDTPLSAEGSWLRIAVPDPDNKRFVMELVFVPFGSCLIRSAALFHSGHYGSPGNTRMHGLLLLEDKMSDTTHLGYINDVLQKQGHPAYGWGLNWSDTAVEYKAHLDAANVMFYHPYSLSMSGSIYFKTLRENAYPGQKLHLWMLNPCWGLKKPDNPKPKKGRKRVSEDPDLEDQEGAKKPSREDVDDNGDGDNDDGQDMDEGDKKLPAI
jgi:hypothetical protein